MQENKLNVNSYVIVETDFEHYGKPACIGKIITKNDETALLQVIIVLPSNTCNWSNEKDKSVYVPIKDIFYQSNKLSDFKEKYPEYFI
jgi:hypothetical protein